MKLNTSYQYVVLLKCFAFVICENFYYSVIAPGVMKSNRKYTVAATLHSSLTPCTIRVSIMGNYFNASDEVALQPFETKKIDFFPAKLDQSDYRLLAEGMNGCKFRNESTLFSDSYSGPKIYIQTDKAVYKPLDLVQFRVVILDEHTRPFSIKEPIRVEIYDSDNNRVKQFKDVILTKGVYTGKFKLSQQPVMGKWKIRVVISGKYSYESEKIITVKLYTLPKFSVYVDVPVNFMLSDPRIRAEIYGKYTFDRYVEGFLKVELRTDNEQLIAHSTDHIDGLATVEIQFENTEIFDNVKQLYLTVMLEEEHTGIQRNESTIITVRRESYNIFIPYDEIEFRNNKPFRLKARVEDWNNGPVFDPETPVILKHGSGSYKTYLNDEGLAVFEFDYLEDASYIVVFKDSKTVLPRFRSYREVDEEIYCRLKLKERPRLGKPVEVEVRSSFNIPYLVYTLVGHASLIKIEYVKVPTNKKIHVIKIMPSIEMIPVSFLFVHYILDGNFRYEELELRFPMELENQVSIEAPKHLKPGQEVILKLKADPKSYVSILAVDLGVYILDSSYDIYKSKILEDLNNERSYVSDANIVRPGILSGLITLTNAHYSISCKGIVDSKGAFSTELEFRKKFPETWIFQSYEINETDTELVFNIPETITTWRITAFSNHAIKGFGVTDGPTDITTFLPFFISLNLPYAVKRDEVVAVPVTIFNYHNQSVDAEVSLFNDHQQFQFIQNVSTSVFASQQTLTAQVPAKSGETVKFYIKPSKIGDVELRVAANSSLCADGVVQKLKVIAEGITKYQNNAQYISPEDKESSLFLDIPLHSVNDSEIIMLSVGGDFMIPSLENLNELVNFPTGCGEQNMVNFAPNVVILDYLRATGKLSKERNLVSKAKYYADIGYQQELSYRHEHGGYSVFGEPYSQEASTWLTAYVTRFFIKASKYVAIEYRIIDSDLEYLAREQQIDGSFPYTGYMFYKELQNTYAFTAFVLLTFMEDRKSSRKYQTTIRKGLEYISSDLDHIDDVYVLSVIAAALSKANHASTNRLLEKLQSYRKEDKKGHMWWSGEGNDVETTAYVLLALVNAPGNHLPILKWLIAQRTRQGGFRSTHDTVVGVEALAAFAKKYNNATEFDMKISYSAQDQEGNELKVDEFLIDRKNVFTLQQHELPKAVRRVIFQSTGNGYSFLQLSSQYNVKIDVELKYFVMKANPTIYNVEQMDLEVCFTYHALKTTTNSTNMVIMEANLPSGFKAESEFSRDLMENDFVQRIEYRNDETVVIIYFDKLSVEVGHCVTIEAFRASEVGELKPAAIVMYDYYNTERFNSLFYTI